MTTVLYIISLVCVIVSFILTNILHIYVLLKKLRIYIYKHVLSLSTISITILLNFEIRNRKQYFKQQLYVAILAHPGFLSQLRSHS